VKLLTDWHVYSIVSVSLSLHPETGFVI
jgi:hypothetical protein